MLIRKCDDCETEITSDTQFVVLQLSSSKTNTCRGDLLEMDLCVRCGGKYLRLLRTGTATCSE